LTEKKGICYDDDVSGSSSHRIAGVVFFVITLSEEG